MEATIYIRFSNQEQAHGSSRERQLRVCREMAERESWAHEPSRVIVDEGKSAFAGVNRLKGSGLGAFEAKVRTGIFRDTGHVLVVENLDRISRQGYEAILPFLSEMTSNGVTVATADGSRIYHAYQRVELGPVIEAVVKAELAREESEKKSRRLRAAQQRKVEQAQHYASTGVYKATTKIVPAWIDVDPVSYLMTLNARRTAVIREIFQWTIDGYGTPAIAKKLNQRGEPVWNNAGRQSKHGWTVGYLTKLVTNRAVIGEARPTNKPRHGKPSSKGIVILNRYPQAIDSATFARAQSARASRRNSSGAWQITHGNLFSGIAKCQACGGRMKQEVTVRAGQTRRRGKGGRCYVARQTISYLKCHNAINRVTDDGGALRCANLGYVRYEALESAVLATALHFAANRKFESLNSPTQLEIEIADAKRHLDDLQRQVDNLVDVFSRTGSPSVERKMLALEAELGELSSAQAMRRARLDADFASRTSPDHLETVSKIRVELQSSEEAVRFHARVLMKQLLRGLISSMSCSPEKETLVILGDNALGLLFDGHGNLIDHQFFRVWGPEGEPDWHPDEEDRLRAA